MGSVTHVAKGSDPNVAGHKYLPLPNQLGPSAANDPAREAWEWKWGETWNERLKSYMRRPSAMPQFTLKEYLGLPAQDAFRRLVLEQAAMGRRDQAQLIYELCLERRCIPLRMLAPVLGRDVLLRQTRRMHDLPGFDRNVGKGAKPLEPSALWQTCFGVPGARDESSSTCSACPQSRECMLAGVRVTEELVARTGTDDPVLARKREAGKLRVREWRAKKAAQHAATF